VLGKEPGPSGFGYDTSTSIGEVAMTPECNGKIELDIRDSVPDWTPPVARAAFSLSARLGRRSPLRLARFEAKHSPPVDAAAIREHGAWLGAAIGEGSRNGAGMVDEYRAFVGPGGFRLGDIDQPTEMYQGTADTLVPPAWGKVLADGITGAELTEYEGEGHMTALSHRADVVRLLAAA
jgi:pimeloyl-ACP methyl ester carboxylesterase